MKKPEIIALFNQFEVERGRNFARILYEFKRTFDHWAMENFNKEGYSDIKIAHVPVIMNIGLEGITNTELSKRLKISRQAMSKTIRELQKLNYIIVKPSDKDKRSLLLFLSDRGMKMVVTAKKRVNKLTNTYKERVGDKKFDQTVSVLLDLLELHSDL
jgi:hypothetical protein